MWSSRYVLRFGGEPTGFLLRDVYEWTVCVATYSYSY
ncbi:hypothetical protein FHS43_002564 [Streptosporangium becharense]|uniref:Uncharacterized protein n=1 Tax=Streptosporangium becharense TaxID=1816182 RepID=A0A7W9IJ14_9ACTN|nr:hypothetical protein [Streptosporangium becharense]MBB5821643.1 hypothetical protein [Streptosporangium becharense]